MLKHQGDNDHGVTELRVEKLREEMKLLALQLNEARNTAEEAVKECGKWKAEAEDVREALHGLKQAVGARDDRIHQLQRKYKCLAIQQWAGLRITAHVFTCALCSGYGEQFTASFHFLWQKPYQQQFFSKREPRLVHSCLSKGAVPFVCPSSLLGDLCHSKN